MVWGVRAIVLVQEEEYALKTVKIETFLKKRAKNLT